MTATLDTTRDDSNLVRKSYWVGFLGSTIIVTPLVKNKVIN